MYSNRTAKPGAYPAVRRLCWALALLFVITLGGCSNIFQGTATPVPQESRPAVGETEPTLALDPSGGYAGTYVDLSGAGWTPSAMVVVKLADEQGRSAVLAAASADSVGEFRTGFIYPIGERWLQSGVQTVVVHTTDEKTELTHVFHVVPPSDVVVSSATPTPAESAVEETQDGAAGPTATGEVIAPVATTATANGATPEPAPPTATAAPNPTAMPHAAPVSVSAPAEAELVLSPAAGPANILVTASGGGFPPNTQVNLLVTRAGEQVGAGNRLILGTAITDGQGLYSIVFGMPLVWPQGEFIAAGPVAVVVAGGDFQRQQSAHFDYVEQP